MKRSREAETRRRQPGFGSRATSPTVTDDFTRHWSHARSGICDFPARLCGCGRLAGLEGSSCPLFVHLSPMRNSHHRNLALLIVDGVDGAIISDPDAPQILCSAQLFRSMWPRIHSKRLYFGIDAGNDFAGEPEKLFFGAGFEGNPVIRHVSCHLKQASPSHDSARHSSLHAGPQKSERLRTPPKDRRGGADRSAPRPCGHPHRSSS